MTPVGSRLQLELDDEVVRMANEWFFKWHFIGKDGPVEIESFRGKPIVYGGIRFSGTAHDVYCSTIQLYLRKKISSIFDSLEVDLKQYPIATRRAEAEPLINAFAGRIRRMAREKDRILRGDGINFPNEHDFGTWEGGKPEDVAARTKSLKLIYCDDYSGDKTLWHRANAFADDHRWWIGLTGLLLGIAGILLTL